MLLRSHDIRILHLESLLSPIACVACQLGSSAINIDDGSDAKINIATSKNHFAALDYCLAITVGNGI